MMRIESSWSVLPQAPNIIVPRQSFETWTPVRPSGRYSMEESPCDAALRVGSGFGDVTAEGLERDGLGLWPAATASVKCIDRGHLVGSELEVEDVDVLGDPRGLGGLRMTDRPCCRPQRSMTWAGLLPCVRAMPRMTGSSSAEEWPLSR